MGLGLTRLGLSVTPRTGYYWTADIDSSVLDTILVSDSTTVVKQTSAASIDTLSLNDSIETRTDYVITVLDSLILTDSVSVVKSTSAVVEDSINFSDQADYLNIVEFVTLGDISLKAPKGELGDATFSTNSININTEIKLSVPKANAGFKHEY